MLRTGRILRHLAPAQASSTPRHVAIVDLSPFRSSVAPPSARAEAAAALSRALSGTGFAVVVGHGVEAEVADRLYSNAMGFFDLGLEQKKQVGGSKGYGESPYAYMEENGAQLLGDFEKPGDVVESLTVDTIDQVPPLPGDLRPAVSHFEEQLISFRLQLHRACEVALGLEDGYLDTLCQERTGRLRLAHYPELKREPMPGQMRYGAHVDSYGLTVLRLDPNHPEGLQVQVEDEWLDIPYVPNAFVINAGALMSRWTNGVWKASVHRVTLNPGRRLSIVTNAVMPRDDVVIVPFETCCDETRPCKYEPIVFGDFRKERVALHRPDYLQTRGIQDHTKVAEAVRSYKQ
mmetsp:Transcript_54285/g.118985  ORF Transcript_54285/g.118985 Transcript_54285/m.118985 type:complete len:347 (+) Transcript_54285:47-1087(+)